MTSILLFHIMITAGDKKGDKVREKIVTHDTFDPL